MTTDETTIPLSKKKLLRVVLASLAFVAVGVVLLLLDADWIQSQRRYNEPLLIYGIGMASVVLFGAAAIYGAWKLFDKRPGLVFDSAGMVDRSSGTAVGMIPWSQVLGAQVTEIHKQRLLIIQVRDPQEFLCRGGALKRALLKANHRMYGTPIVIAATGLGTEFATLQSLFDQYRHRYGPGATGATG